MKLLSTQSCAKDLPPKVLDIAYVHSLENMVVLVSDTLFAFWVIFRSEISDRGSVFLRHVDNHLISRCAKPLMVTSRFTLQAT